MAQRITTTLTCDWPHGGKDVEATTTMHFTFEATEYEVDVCPLHVEKARRLVGQVTEHARTVKGTRPAAKRTAAPGRRARANGVNSTLVRAWAKNRGIELSQRGRIPTDVVRQYEAAQATA